MQSLYYASHRRDLAGMRDELALRQKYGFDVEWLAAANLERNYGIRAPGAILGRLAARVDPYRMASRLLRRLQKRGTHVFDRSHIEQIKATSRSVTLRTDEGFSVRANHAILAGGYANQIRLKQKVAQNRSSYAFITDPLDDDTLGRMKNTMVWESARPYLYLRSAGDGRLLVGGEDDAIDIPARRDARVERKAARPCKRSPKPCRACNGCRPPPGAGTFAETDDGLPFFGPHPQHGPRLLFAMTYDGNGATYSMLGAGLLRALIERRKHPLRELFSFDRLR